MDKVFYINFLNNPQISLDNINNYLSTRDYFIVRSVTPIGYHDPNLGDMKIGALVVVGSSKK